MDSAVTVEQLPVPLPLDTEPRSPDLTDSNAVTINTIVQEIPQPSTEPLATEPSAPVLQSQLETTPDATTEAPSQTEAPQEAQEADASQPTEITSQNEAPPQIEAAQEETGARQDNEAQETLPDSDSPAVDDTEEHAYWVEEEEDTSVPDEAELKEIAEGDRNQSALDHEYWEKSFYPSLDDPEYHPAERVRLMWKFKGVRGTKEKPNRAKIMRSPPAFAGGYWWTIKFFPRGNNVGSLSVYIECSPTLPKPDDSLPETEFKITRGPGDRELEMNAPDLDIKFGKTEDTEAWAETFKTQYPAAASQSEPSKETWRVSAQIAVIAYNPDEPRTGFFQSSCHQFNPHNPDWGWTNFHGPWDQIHRRQHLYHRALLQDDTVAFGAYIRIFDDPTKSLWWHPCDAEPTWDSLGLTGYRPLGDSVVNHSAEVAGLATLLHVAPFCKIIQSVNVLEHLTNCDVKPKPLCDALQKFLWQLRQRDQSLQYVDTDAITSTLRNLHEGSRDVCAFWERLRRSLELELEGTPAAKELAQLFDSPSLDSLPEGVQREDVNRIPRDYNSRICVPADKAKTMGEALSWYLGAKAGRWVLPPVLHVELGRQTLDKVARQWRLLYNRVDLDEELDLSSYVMDGQCGKYALYGYIVHRGRRTSGKFFSILRPGGPGSKWLAFDDGSDNRVECLTQKTALGPHLGLDPGETPDHKTGHDVAIAVMYIRSDVVKEFLPGPQGPWEVSDDLKQYYETGQASLPKKTDSEAEQEDIQVEVYTLQKYDQLGSLFDSYDLMSQAKAANSVMYLSVPRSTNLIDVRKKIGLWASTQSEREVSPENIRLWQIGHTRDRCGPTLALKRVSDLTTTVDLPVSPVRYWLQIVSDGEAKYFAMKDPEIPVVTRSKPEEAVVERAGSETSDEVQPAPATEGAEAGSSSNQNQSPADGTPSAAVTLSEQPAVTEPIIETTETPAPVAVEVSESGTPAISASSNAEEPSPESDEVTAPVGTEDSPSTEPSSGATENPAPATETPETPQTEAPASATAIDESSSNENDAVIAAIIAGDVQQLDEELQPPAPSQEQEPSPPTPEDQTNAPVEQETTNTENATPPEPENILPVEHVYYYIQLFDIESQSLRTMGSFFSKRKKTIKRAIRKHLDWPATKDFQVWQRVDNTEIQSLASAETFEIDPADGTCFIVGDKLKSEERAQYNEKGLFANPNELVRYLWAASRNHPIKAFTGTKTVEATFTSDYYSGDFMKGYRHGKGKHISDSAATYTGDFALNKRHGKGLMEYPTGDTYDGDWFDDKCHGQGTFVERKTGNKYVGGYKDGKRHGKGISYWEVADEEMDLCQICFSEEQDALFYDCGHVCACVVCARQVDICPICRKNIVSVVKIYRT
ncbi:putative MATH and UCH domain protein [Aspergillus undulatus]|uniref:putative MATH and UCH domain protein n=1 Tax=Aspergillus undulatus TaxID=1810928 RepID=UPI003CCDEFDF